jgi:hypothetical protein
MNSRVRRKKMTCTRMVTYTTDSTEVYGQDDTVPAYSTQFLSTVTQERVGIAYADM